MSTLTLSKQDVKDIAEDLMNTNGSTTTLEVKMELRSRGFWATQADVRDFMDEISEEADYDVQQNGAYRVFKLESQPITQTQKANFLHSIFSTPSTPAAPRFSSKAMVSIKESEADTGDWKVYSTLVQDELFFDKQYTRDQVRCAFRLQFPMAIKFTRACRIK